MKNGIIYPQTELQEDPEAVRCIGAAREELGFNQLLIYDHVLGASQEREPRLNGPYTDKHPSHDPLVMFSCLGAADAFAASPRLMNYLREAGRPSEGFAMQINMLKAKDPETVVETVKRWQDVGGTHASVSTIGQGFERLQSIWATWIGSDALRKAGALQ